MSVGAKYDSEGTAKIPNFNFVMNSEKLTYIWELQPKTNIQKFQFWIYRWIGKIFILIYVSLSKIKWGIYTIWSHFKLDMVNNIFDFLTFQDFINELGEICLPLEKMEFWSNLKFCAYYWILTLGKALLTLFTLYLLILIMQLSTQTDNHKYRKSDVTKKIYSLKNVSEISKS